MSIYKGDKCIAGAGLPPTAIVKQNGDSATIIITDQNGQTSATVRGGLPAVTSADEGKLLSVINGSWAATSIINAEEVKY